MDSEPLVTALNAVIHRLIQLASEDAQLRTKFRRLAEAIFEITGTPDQQAAPEPAVEETPAVVAPVQPEVVSTVVTEEPAPAPAQAVLLEAAPFAPPPVALPEALAQAKPAVEPATIAPPTRRPRTADSELLLIEARCRLKSEAARWAVTRSHLLAEGVDFRTEIQAKDADMISKAGSLDDCLLWMSRLSGTPPNRYEDLARCFEALADVVSQIPNELDRHRGEFERSLNLLAEAESALRVAIAAVEGPTDTDQVQVSNRLKATAKDRQLAGR